MVAITCLSPSASEVLQPRLAGARAQTISQFGPREELVHLDFRQPLLASLTEKNGKRTFACHYDRDAKNLAGAFRSWHKPLAFIDLEIDADRN